VKNIKSPIATKVAESKADEQLPTEKYKIKDTQDTRLREARRIVRDVWTDNYKKWEVPASVDGGNQMRAHNSFYENTLVTASGYPELHGAIFDALKNEADPEDDFYQGLYEKLSEKGFTYEDLKDCLEKPENIQQRRL